MSNYVYTPFCGNIVCSRLSSVDGDILEYITPSFNIYIHGDIYRYENERFTDDFIYDLLNNFSLEYLKKMLVKFDGYFSLIIFDKTKHKTYLCSDRYGLKPIYYKSINNKICKISDSLSLLAEKKDFSEDNLDKTAISFFLDTNSFLNQDTYFNNIKRLKPATILSFGPNDDIDECLYWSWNEIEHCSLDFDKAVDYTHKLFFNAVKKRLPLDKDTPLAITLSGGLDSRALLAVTHSLGYKNIKAFTFGKAESPDVIIAKSCCEILSIPHEIIPLDENNWNQGREDGVILSGGMSNYFHMHVMPAVETISSFSNIVLNGYLGDLVLGGGYLFKNVFDKPLEYLEALNVKYSKSLTSKIDKNLDYFSIDNSDSFFIYQRGVRFTSMGSDIVSNKLRNIKPFMDNKLLEFIYSLPSSYRTNGCLYHSMLTKYYPELFCQIPWQSIGKPVSYSKPSENISYKAIFKNVSRIIIKKSILYPLSKKIYILFNSKIENNRKSFVSYSQFIKNKDFNKYLDFIYDEESISMSIFSRSILEKIINNAYETGNVEKLGCLISLELFSRNILDD